MDHTGAHPLPTILTTASGIDDFDAPPTLEQLATVQTTLANYLREHGPMCPPSDYHPEQLLPQLAQHAEAMTTSSITPIDDVALWAWDAYTVPAEERAAASTAATESTLSLELQQIAAVCGARDLAVLLPTATGEFVIPPAGIISATHASSSLRKPIPNAVCTILAQATALLGAPCVVTDHDLAHPTVFAWAHHVLLGAEWRRAIGENSSTFCIPFYQWTTSQPHLCAVIIAHRDHPLPPLNALQWYEFIERGQRCVEEKMLTATPVPTRGAASADTWSRHAQLLARNNIPWMSPRTHGKRESATQNPEMHHCHLSGMNQWLQQILRHVGSPCPSATLHPTALKQQLMESLQRGDAEQFSASTSRSAVSLSQSAREGKTQDSIGMLLTQVEQQLATPSLILTLFARFTQQEFWLWSADEQNKIASDEYAAYRMLANVAVIHGAPLFISSHDQTNPIYPLVRELLDDPVAVQLIPVYRWRDRALKIRPRFQGVFLAVYEEGTPPPTPREWLQWQFLCQTMHAPIEIIGKRVNEETKRAGAHAIVISEMIGHVV